VYYKIVPIKIAHKLAIKIKIIYYKNGVYVLFCSLYNIIFNLLVAQLVKYDVHTTPKIKFIHATFYHILLLSCIKTTVTSDVKFDKLQDHFAMTSG